MKRTILLAAGLLALASPTFAQVPAPPPAPGPFDAAVAAAPANLRDGAMRWGLFNDPASPTRYVETFLVESWAEHMRQHERVTVADHEAEEVSRAFHIGDQPPVVAHFIAAND